MSTLFLVPLLYGGQEQIVRQMRDELLNSSREVQKEAKPHHGLHGVRSGSGWIFYVCLLPASRGGFVGGWWLKQGAVRRGLRTLEEDEAEVMGFVSWGVETHSKHGTCREK